MKYDVREQEGEIYLVGTHMANEDDGDDVDVKVNFSDDLETMTVFTDTPIVFKAASRPAKP